MYINQNPNIQTQCFKNPKKCHFGKSHYLSSIDILWNFSNGACRAEGRKKLQKAMILVFAPPLMPKFYIALFFPFFKGLCGRPGQRKGFGFWYRNIKSAKTFALSLWTLLLLVLHFSMSEVLFGRPLTFQDCPTL